jgi:hypothetical protein
MQLTVEVADEFNFKLIDAEHERQLRGEPQFMSSRSPQTMGYITLKGDTGATIRYALQINPATGLIKVIPAIPKLTGFDSMSQAEVIEYAATRKNSRGDANQDSD